MQKIGRWWVDIEIKTAEANWLFGPLPESTTIEMNIFK
jgi:hypothetical protein